MSFCVFTGVALWYAPGLARPWGSFVSMGSASWMLGQPVAHKAASPFVPEKCHSPRNELLTALKARFFLQSWNCYMCFISWDDLGFTASFHFTLYVKEVRCSIKHNSYDKSISIIANDFFRWEGRSKEVRERVSECIFCVYVSMIILWLWGESITLVTSLQLICYQLEDWYSEYCTWLWWLVLNQGC